MNAAGARFWLLGEAAHWRGRRHAAWDDACRTLHLASERELRPALGEAEAFTHAQQALEQLPRAVDEAECVARWDAAAQAVVVHSALPGQAVLMPLAEGPRDLCHGADGVLYLALPGRVRLHCLRGRWPDAEVALPGFEPWRLAAHPQGGVWVLERSTGQLARVQGLPLPQPAPQREDYDARVFRPTPENARAPQLLPVASAPWAPPSRAVALASGPWGELAVLAWRGGPGGEGQAWLYPFDAARGRYSAPLHLLGAHHAYALAWVAPGRVVLRVPGRRDAPAYALAAADAQRRVPALGEVYPLAADVPEAPFANGAVMPPCFPAGAQGVQPVHALSLHQWAGQGEAANFALDAEGEGEGREGPAPHLIDSGDTRTVWHRLYAEASLPPGTGFVAWLAATDEPAPPALDAEGAWHAHRFGEPAPGTEPPAGPQAAWQREASELPAHAGLLAGERLPGRRGLFGVLVQTSQVRVRTLQGRYLWVRLALHGDGRATPEVAALRAWAGRVDWVQRHLPRLYRETLAGAAASAPGPATGADFLSRMVANFESVLTPLEDAVAAAHLRTDPAATPAEHLDWLASWVGAAFDPALGEAARREWLARSGELARWHGTRHGLELALDIATGHAVQGGEVIVIEDFRLRRLLATLLGVDLADERDPLLPGLAISGNSIVGDTLFVGDAPRAELMALFRAQQASAAENAAENTAVIDFDRQLAHRATVLVHREVQAQDFRLIERIVQQCAPAHVQVRVAAATWPLMVGVASLVGVDTYLGPKRPRQPARVQRSVLGAGDHLSGPALLDPRLSGAPVVPVPTVPPPSPPPAALPVANAGPDLRVPGGQSFVLDASASRAAPGRSLTQYRWRWLPPEFL